MGDGGASKMYDKGEGVPKDYVLAHMSVNLAAVNLPRDTIKDAANVRDALEHSRAGGQIFTLESSKSRKSSDEQNSKVKI
jgi:hypothetical protein